jgi:hypothetical protein
MELVPDRVPALKLQKEYRNSSFVVGTSLITRRECMYTEWKKWPTNSLPGKTMDSVTLTF